MVSTAANVLLCIPFIFVFIHNAYSISCYQCSGTDSNQPFECNEFLTSDTDLEPQNCSTIHNAQFCIKHVGRYEGGISTKRHCSSLDLGNYCNYVQQPGDKLEYRTCVYTCSTDGCNAAPLLARSLSCLSLACLLAFARTLF